MAELWMIIGVFIWIIWVIRISAFPKETVQPEMTRAEKRHWDSYYYNLFNNADD